MLSERNRIDEEGYKIINYDIINGGEIVGALALVISEEGTYLERIDVDEEWRGGGLGTDALYEITTLYGSMYASPDNEGSQRLFARLGDDVSEEHWMVDQGYGVYEI